MTELLPKDPHDSPQHTDDETAQEEDTELYAVMGNTQGLSEADRQVQMLRHADPASTDPTLPFHQIEFLSDVPVTMQVEVGRTRISVREILGLKMGSVIEFPKPVGDPMEVTISGRVMARGEIVVVNERYGVRISEVTRADEATPAGDN